MDYVVIKGTHLEMQAPRENLTGFLDDLANEIQTTNILVEGLAQVEEWWSNRINTATEHQDQVVGSSTSNQRMTDSTEKSSRWSPILAVSLVVEVVVFVVLVVVLVNH